ncbi:MULTISPECIES: NAD-dependent epimerase/dehydratase family protein [Clavibacter]|uniref:NAD-dependent epimerase/dehydratase family protein n=3 Tax=Clavibacter TaxID=1573 RepID=A0ABY3TA74_9MICO|nr:MULTISPECIES: NAD-dependent epimerase/dehydratase family protein [Clavibacter]KDP90668.1 reductase [Clavibacter cf. michiganensis LMG 26808]UKF26219.1 NAD-dependent epimerase/dehydratase family protein [Clavibacter sp. A6099]
MSDAGIGTGSTGAPRDVLVLGGTGWIGRLVAERLAARGDRVTCLARGTGGSAPDLTRFAAADRDLPDAYAAVVGADWDEVVDLTSSAEHASSAVTALGERARHWTLVSTVSVYASFAHPGEDETAALVEPVDLEEYGQAKVAAERAVTAALAGRRMIVRPGLIVGPGDDSDRFGYWPARFALAGDGPVLVPDATGRHSQAIDARDLADLVVDVGVRALDGVVDAVGESVPLADALDLAAEVAGSTGERVVATDDQLAAADVRHWAGPRSLPLWLPGTAAGMLARSDAGIRALGAARRPLAETMRDVLADERERGIDRPRASGLARDEELQVLAALG